jgi:hypothetical protein
MTLKKIVAIDGAAPAFQPVAVGSAINKFDSGGSGGGAYVLKASSGGGSLLLKATGTVGENVRWSASIDYVAGGLT